MLTNITLRQQRLQNLQITTGTFQKPGELVKWMGAVQAQDYPASLWALGLRMNGVTEKDMEQAISGKQIVRTWPMRGTLHFVAQEDVRWMLKLLTPRVIARSASLYRNAGLDEKVFAKSRRLISKALEGGKQLTRPQIYEILEKAKISTASQRGLHILGYLAQDGLICLASRKGKQHTFTLLDEWVPPGRMLTGDEALRELAIRYFTSHGPATVQDFAWWSGLTLTEAKNSLEIIKSSVLQQKKDDQVYWSFPDVTVANNDIERVHLLPNFDEYAVGYTDRRVLAETAHENKFTNSFSFLNASIIADGKIAGFWKRSLIKNEMVIEAKPFSPLNKATNSSLEKAVMRYSNFAGVPVKPK